MIWNETKEYLKLFKVLVRVYGNREHRITLINIFLLLSQFILWIVVSCIMINFTWDNSTFFVICLGAIAWMVICYFWFPHIAKNMVNHFYNKHNYYALEERLSNKWSVIEYKDFSKAGRDSPDIDQDQLPYLTSFVSQYQRPYEQVPEWNIFRIMLQYINDKVRGR